MPKVKQGRFISYSFGVLNPYLAGSNAEWHSGIAIHGHHKQQEQTEQKRENMPPSFPYMLALPQGSAVLTHLIPALDSKPVTNARFRHLHDYMRLGGPPRHKP